jgi:hypothetical protein
VGVKIGCATVGMITVGQELALTPATVVAPPGRGAFAAAAPLSGGGATLGLVATVGVVLVLQGWLGNPLKPEGLAVPVALCAAEAP